MHHTIGVYEAKSKLSALLHEIKKGHSFTITVRGQEMAELTPVSRTTKVKKALSDLSDLRKQLGLSGDLESIQAAKAVGRR